MILEHGEVVKVKNSNGVEIAALYVDSSNFLYLVPQNGNLNGIRIGADPTTGNGGIHVNLGTGEINLYGTVKVNGNVVATV